MNFDYLIIGGGVAGTTAAETIRKKDSEVTIGIVSEEPYNFYSRILLSKPNFFLGVVPFDSVWLRRDEWYAQNRITLLAGKKAVSLNSKERSVDFNDGTKINYGKLLLAIGAKARKCNYPGSDKKGIYYLRSLDDAKRIIEVLENVKKPVIVGGGFIGFEMSDLMHLARKHATFVIREDYYWKPRLDRTAGKMIEKALVRAGIKLKMKSEVKEFLGGEKVEYVLLEDGTKIQSDAILIGIGGKCPHGWVRAAGVKVNNGILANEYLETSAPNIWTAGDAAEYKDNILDEVVNLGNWVNAQEQGRQAGLNMAGEKKPFHFVSFYCLGLRFAATILSSQLSKRTFVSCAIAITLPHLDIVSVTLSTALIKSI